MDTPDALAQRLAHAIPSLPGFDELRVRALSPRGRIDALVAGERMRRRVDAFMASVLAEMERAARVEVSGATEAEVSAALRWPVNTVKTRLAEAGTLAERFPQTLAAVAVGEVSFAQARALVETTTVLSDEAARGVQDRILPRMATQSQAVTRQALRRAVIAADPDAEAKSHAEAQKRRRVELRAEDDGMATVSLFTTAETARGLLNALDRRCRRKAKGDSRTLDQRRADTLAALVLRGERLTASSGADAVAVVHVVVNIETLLGLSDAPGEIEGYGPVGAVQARALAAGKRSVLRRMVVNGAGELLAIDSRTYRPCAGERRFIVARDRHCDFPGCQVPARLCDLDHEIPHAQGGRTGRGNLCPRCRRHHNLKTRCAFECTHEGSTAIWTSKATGRSYTNTPEPYPVLGEEDLVEE
jgi:hypothetical protein